VQGLIVKCVLVKLIFRVIIDGLRARHDIQSNVWAINRVIFNNLTIMFFRSIHFYLKILCK
jgi:hypothetical protein